MTCDRQRHGDAIVSDGEAEILAHDGRGAACYAKRQRHRVQPLAQEDEIRRRAPGFGGRSGGHRDMRSSECSGGVKSVADHQGALALGQEVLQPCDLVLWGQPGLRVLNLQLRRNTRHGGRRIAREDFARQPRIAQGDDSLCGAFAKGFAQGETLYLFTGKSEGRAVALCHLSGNVGNPRGAAKARAAPVDNALNAIAGVLADLLNRQGWGGTGCGNTARHRMRGMGGKGCGGMAAGGGAKALGPHRAAIGQRPGLVPDRTGGGGQAFQRRALLDQHALSHQAARRHDMRHRHGQGQRTGAGDDQHADRDKGGAVPVAGGEQPADESGKGDKVNDRRIKLGCAVGNAHIGAAALFGPGEHPHRHGKETVFDRPQRHGIDRAGQVQRAGLHLIARSHRNWRRFARQKRAVQIAGAGGNAQVHRDALARRDAQHHTGADRVGGHGAQLALGRHFPCLAHRKPLQPRHRRARLAAHAVVQIAPNQQEERQRHRRVKEDIFATAQGLKQAQRQGQRDGQRNRHIHIHARPAQRAPSRDKKEPRGIEHDGQGDDA